jgi:hypothetical protein
MGTPVPPLPVGRRCDICWGPGLRFGDVPTPGVLVMTVSGIGKTAFWEVSDGEPVDGTFEVPQDLLVPCFWLLRIGLFRIHLLFQDEESEVRANNAEGSFCFFQRSDDKCVSEYLDNVPNPAFEGGSIIVENLRPI